jgi:predicted transcriptional regulator
MAMTVRLTEELEITLGLIAQERKVSKQRVIEELIEAAGERSLRKARLAQAFELVMTRDKELMERLADA